MARRLLVLLLILVAGCSSGIREGEKLLARGEKKQALASFDRAAKTAEDCKRTAALLRDEGMESESLVYLVRGVRLAGSGIERSELYTAIGDTYQSMGRDAEADAAYRKAVSANRWNSTALNNRAYMYAESGKNLDEALRLAKRAVKMKPDERNFLDTLGWVYYKKGDYGSALEYLSRAAGSPDAAEIRYHLGLAYLKTGKREKAWVELQKALVLDPSHSGAKAAMRDAGFLPRSPRESSREAPG